jgi:hypothetical protein
MPDRIGAAAELCEALAQVGINIEGAAAYIRGGQPWGVLNILVEEPELARKVIEEANFEISDDREALIIELEDAPGALANALRTISQANASIDLLYFASRNRLVIGTEQMRRARSGIKTIDAKYP